MKRIWKKHCVECVFIVIILLLFIVALCFKFGQTESEKALLIALVATLIIYGLKICLDELIDKCFETKRYGKTIFSSLDHCYLEMKEKGKGEKEQKIVDSIREIQFKYEHITIDGDTIRYFEGDNAEENVTIIECESLLTRAAYLKNQISLPSLGHEILGALLPVICTIVVAIPSFINNQQINKVVLFYCTPVMACLLSLIVVKLSTRKMSVKTELINYELSLLEKKISVFQDKSIQQQQIKKENPNEKQ